MEGKLILEKIIFMFSVLSWLMVFFNWFGFGLMLWVGLIMVVIFRLNLCSR